MNPQKHLVPINVSTTVIGFNNIFEYATPYVQSLLSLLPVAN